MAKVNWPKLPTVVSVALSLTAAGLLIWHVFYDPSRKIDGWAIALLVVLFLPWLGAVFEAVEFPGGGKVQWRARVEAEQQRQAAEIEALTRFLAAGFLTNPEREILRRLDSGTPWPVGVGPTKDAVTTHALLDKGLIAQNPPATPDAEFATMQDAYRVTPDGRYYLDVIAKLPDGNHGAR